MTLPAAIVDSHLYDALGRGYRRAGMPPTPQLILDGVTASALDNFLDMTPDEQREAIRMYRRGELGDAAPPAGDRRAT